MLVNKSATKTSILKRIKSPEDLKKLSIKELKKLAIELRDYIISVVSTNGGHLASNMGVIELTIALHTILNSPTDKIIWDVGHQCYPHKILTGRFDEFNTIRQYKGLSGFPKISESDHDIFGAGHATTSISAALGIAKSRDLNNEDFSIFSIIGDGSLTGGMAYEAINNMDFKKRAKFTVILNDNEMSISNSVGMITKIFSCMKKFYDYFHIDKISNQIESLVGKIPKISIPICQNIEKLASLAKGCFTDKKISSISEELGFQYIGPIFGHNIISLMAAISYAKEAKHPVLLHIITKKGKGYINAEMNPEDFHGVSPFSIKSGIIKTHSKSISYSEIFGRTLCEIAKKNKKICAVTAAMTKGTGLKNFSKLFSERFFDVGIAEQHAVTFAAGLARNGHKPYVAIYSTFFQRSYDQIIHDVCLQNLPVVFIADRAGLVGNDGPTHHGVFDISFLRHIPNLVCMAPKDINELKNMMYFAEQHNGAVSIRFMRGKMPYDTFKKEITPIELGKGEVVFEKNNNSISICIIAIGNMVDKSYKAAEKLAIKNYSVNVINARFIKPLDKELILNKCKKSDLIVTVEDGVIKGGFGSSILELLAEKGILKKSILIGLPDKFIEHGNINILNKKYKLDDNSIYEKILDHLENIDDDIIKIKNKKKKVIKQMNLIQ